MAGTVHALLLPARGEAATVPLAPGSGLALLPLTDEIVAEVIGPADDAVVPGFYDLSVTVAAWARRRSRYGAVGYLHVEFFGGTGFHAAMAWRDGSVAWGPVFTANADGEAEAHYAVVERADMAVNQLLRQLGVRRRDEIDEYAAAGLTRCRWTSGWAELVPPR